MQNIPLGIKIPINKILSILLILLFATFSFKCVTMAFTSAFSFDGAMNAQVPLNLIKNFKYATSFDTIKEFDQIIQTGIPVLLPVAIFFKLFGVSFSSALMVNAIYMIALGLAIILYLKDCLKLNTIFVLSAFILFWSTPEIMGLGFGLLGEIPTLFYILLALIIYAKTSNSNFLFFSGLSLGVGYLTKTVALIALPAFIVVMLMDYSQAWFFSKKRDIWRYLLFLIGLITPILLFEIFKMLSLGFSAYVSWWIKQSNSIFMQAGVTKGLADTDGILTKFLKHSGLLSSFVKTDQIVIFILIAILLLFFGLLWWIYIKQFITKKRYEGPYFSNHFAIIITITLSYLGWWLLLTPTAKAWHRRIIDGTILAELCLTIGIYLCYRFFTDSNKSSYKHNFILAGISVPLLFIAFFRLGSSQNSIVTLTDSKEKIGYLEAGQFIQKLPGNAKLFGFGWWQSPIIAFTSERSFNDFYKNYDMNIVGAKKNVYIIADNFSYYIDPNAIESILGNFEYKVAYQDDINKIFIYKLNNRLSSYSANFSESEISSVSNHSIDFTNLSSENIFVRNVYIEEQNNSAKWVQKNSAYLLKYSNENQLDIFVSFPSLENYDDKLVEIDIYVNRLLVKKYIATQAGLQKISISLNNIKSATVEVSLLCNSKVINISDERETSFLINKIELINPSATK